MKRSFLTLPLPIDKLLGALFFVVILLTRSLLQDGDTGVHIRVGEYMLQTHSFLRLDPFSYFTPPVVWNNHEWLAEIIMALLAGFGGLKAVVFFYSLLITVSLILLFRQIQSKSNTKTAIFISFFVFINLAIHFHARPHLFTLFFLIIWQKIIDNFQSGKKNQMALLPLLMLLWVNFHGGFVIGIFYLGIYGAGNFILAVMAEASKKAALMARTRTIFLTLIGCLAVTLLNPDGLHLWKYIFALTSNNVLMDHISEFVSVDFHSFSPWAHMIYVTLIILAAAQTSLSLIQWMLIAFFSYMALYSIRHVTLLTVVASPILAEKFLELWEMLESKIAPKFLGRPTFLAKQSETKPSIFFVFFNIVYMGIILIGIGYALSPAKTYAYDPALKPVQALEFIQQEKLPGRSLNDDEFSDFMIYKLWPEQKVFCYGFNDKAGLERFKDYYAVRVLAPEWREVLEKHQVNWVMHGTTALLSNALSVHPGWKLIYSDKVASIFIRNIPENQAWIEKFPNVSLVKVPPVKENRGIINNVIHFFTGK